MKMEEEPINFKIELNLKDGKFNRDSIIKYDWF